MDVVIADRYEVVRELGRGGFATVLLAADRQLGREVAVKRLADHVAEDEAFVKRFVREAQLAAKLSHPNVVQVFDAGRDERGRPFIVSEFVPGGTLAQRLVSDGPLPPHDVIDLGVQICAGLQAAHDQGMVHRDIKPANLLCRTDGTVKIADFGVAKLVDDVSLTVTGTVLGTLLYLAPEQASGEQVTAAADLYSLGATLYEMLSGRPPFRADNLAQMMVEREAGHIEALPAGLPAAVTQTVMQALERDPDRRPRSAAHMARALAATDDAATTVALPSLPATAATQVLSRSADGRAATTVVLAPVRRWRPRTVIVLAGLSLALIVALVMSASGDDAKQNEPLIDQRQNPTEPTATAPGSTAPPAPTSEAVTACEQAATERAAVEGQKQELERQKKAAGKENRKSFDESKRALDEQKRQLDRTLKGCPK